MLRSSLGGIGLHALTGYILIVLLLTAPCLVVLALGVSSEKRALFLRSALVILLLGTLATFVAVNTGYIAAKAIRPTLGFKALVDEHRTLAETTRALFSVLTLGLAALLLVPRLLRRELERRISAALMATYLIVYATGALFLIHTAIQGGLVAQEFDQLPASTYELSKKENVK